MGYGIFENHKDEPYQFQEYPKWVKLKDGKTVLVNSQREELTRMDEIMGALPSDDPLLLERNDLAAKVAELQAQLAKVQEEAKAQGKEPEKPEPPKPSAIAATLAKAQ